MTVSGPISPAPGDVAAILDLLTAHPVFGKLGPQAISGLAQHSVATTVRAGETLMRQGESDTYAAYAILDGEVDIFVELPAGQIHLATVGRNRIIGELGAVSGMPRTATVVTRSPVSMLRIERDRLLPLMMGSPEIGIAIIGELGRRLQGVNRSLAYLTYAATALGRDEYDPAMIEELTHQPGEMAVFARAFATMAHEITQKQRRREEMEAAAAIQSSILPPPLAPDPLGHLVDLHAEMHPAREIGGDFYDYFWIEPGRLALTVADVAGKGIPAALFMAVARTVLRNTAGADLALRMTAANRLLSVDNSANMFVTLFHGEFDLATGTLDYCNAGHNPPYVLRGGGGREPLVLTDIPFGIDLDHVCHAGQTRLMPGDSLFVYSDGITEAFDRSDREFGVQRLEAALEQGRGAPAAVLTAGVLAAVAEFTQGAEQSDDITSLALAYGH